jgi:hypothetical protein
VFADFEFGPNGGLFLVRISFDGYGCCEPAACVGELSADKTRRFIEHIQAGSVGSPEVEEILRSYFSDNKSLLWEEALVSHGLI